MRRLGDFRWAVRLRCCRMYHFGHRVERFREGMDGLRRRVEDLWDAGVGGRTGRRVGRLGQVVLIVGRMVPVTVIDRDVAVVPVVRRFC